MRKNRKSQEENLPKSKQNIWTGYGNFGYSDKALSALERGQYDQLTGRDPVYRTSQDQTKPAKQNVVPALEGITRSDAWQSSFGRKKSGVDTANARSKYEQRIGHVTPDMAQKNLSNKGYSSTHKDIDFSKLDDIELSYLEADEMRRDDERAKQERHRGVKAGSPADKYYTWLDSLDNIDTEEDKIARSQRYIDKYGASRDEVIDAYKQYKEGLERQKRIEHPYLEGLKDFPSALRRGLEQGAAWASNLAFPNSDLDQMLHSDTALKKSKEVEKKRDYSRNSYKATDSDRNNLETYYSVGDLLTSAAEGNLLTGGFGVVNPSTGFAMSVEPSKAARVVANAVPSYGLEAENKYRAAKREGIDEDRAKELANTSGMIAGALGAASALGAGSAAANSGKSAIRSILESGAKSGGVAIGRQGAEELADKLLLGNQSTFDRSVQNYMAQGMSEEEAGKQAGRELATRLLGAGAGGFLLGAGSEAVGNIFSKGASKLANNAADDLNTVWDFQKALPQNEVPLLSGSSEPTTAVTGATYNSVPALADNIYPIQMPGTNGVINLPGETAPIMLPDLAAQSMPAVKNKVMAESIAPIPRLIKKLEGEELTKAQKQIADNKRQITTSNERMKAIMNDKSNYRAGKLKKAASQQVKAIKKEIANYKNENKLLDRQIKGGVKPVTEYLDYVDNRLLNGFKSDVKTIGKQIGDTDLAKRVLTNLDKYVESGDKADLREYAMELWQLNNVATEKGVINPEETDLFMSGMHGLDRVFQKSRELNPTTEVSGASAPVQMQEVAPISASIQMPEVSTTSASYVANENGIKDDIRKGKLTQLSHDTESILPRTPEANSLSLSSNDILPSEEVNVKAEAPDNGYWNRILGDKEFLALEAQKQNVDPQTLVDYANKNLGYDVAPTNNVPNGGNNVPPSNNVPPVDRPEPPKGMKERGMSRHMGDEEKMIVDIPQEVRDDFINDPDMYEALSNKATSEKALNIYNEHPDDREAIFRDMLTQYDPAALPLGQMIAKDYSAKGNHAMAAQIFRDMGERLTKAGQFSQASILTMLKNDPLTAQEYAQKAVDKLNMQGKKEFGKKWNNMSLTKEELDAFNEIDPGDEKALAALYDKIGQRLGREYPTTLMEKLLEGRKVAMLFNVRTISRNFFANPPTLGMRYMADKVEAVGQNIAHLIDPTFKKTQSLNSGGIGKKLAKEFVKSERYQQLVHGVDEKHMVPDLKSEIIHHKQMYKGTAAEKFIDTWAGNAFNSISDALYEAGKIKSNPHIKGGIQAINEKAFNKSDVQSILETIRNTTYKLLDVTDSPFVKKNFSQRLASYLNAQGITNLKDIPQEAIDIAWNEALKATYKDDSWMVKALSGVKGGIEKIPGIGKPLSQGLIPFLQAPGNIAARMVDYSPINLTKGIGQIIKGAAKKDHNTIRKGIEAAAKGLTGSALAVLGMKLYESGILTGDYSQDNKEKSFQQRNGFKPWSLHVDGNYFSFNWMQPFAQSIMAGILAQQAIDNADQFDSDVLRHFGIEGSTAGKVIGAAYQSGKSAVNSWFDESPLGDLTKLFSGSYFDRDIAQNIVDVGEDFAGAMYPATGNAAAKTIDTTKRNTKDPSNRFSTFLNEQMAKIPFVSEKLPAAYDTWGEEIKYSDSPVEAAFQRFVYPGEYSSDSSDPLDVEIQRLFNATSDNRAFPLYAANKVGDKTLNNKEKSEYQKDMGQRAKQFAQAFVNSDRYKEMDDANRVETLNTLYYTSKAITERDVFGKPVADSSQYKKYIQAYDDAGGGDKGIEAVVNFSEAKSAMKAGNISASSNLGKQVEKAAKEGDTKTVEKITNAAQSVEDLGFTKAGPKETYIKASSIDPSLSLEEFGKTYREIDTNNNQGLSQKEVINYLNANKVPEVKGQKMWDMYAPHGKKVPYVKEDGTWGTH